MAKKKRRSSGGRPPQRRPADGGRAPAARATRRTGSSRGRTILLGAVVAIVIAGFVAPLLVRDNGPTTSTTTSSTGPRVEIKGLMTFELPRAGHTPLPVAYAQVPPVGGDHDPVWLNCGYYPAPVRDANAVHSMEHGAVWITYRPDLPAAQVARLREIAHRLDYVVVSPYPNLPAPVVASAWATQLQMPAADDARLTPFLDQFRSGAQAPERGSPCEGGTGTPE